jgi:hypothetical protein
VLLIAGQDSPALGVQLPDFSHQLLHLELDSFERFSIVSVLLLQAFGFYVEVLDLLLLELLQSHLLVEFCG